jgi:hypothetical protein
VSASYGRQRRPGPIDPNALSTPPAPWTPAEITTALWLDGDDSTTITLESSAVSEWRDKSGNTRHVSQGTAGARPAMSTFGGLDAVSFDGGDQLVNGSTGITSGTYSGELTIVYVATRADSTGGTILSDRTTGNAAVFQWWQAGGERYIFTDGVNAGSNHLVGSGVFALLDSDGAVVAHQHVSGARDNLWVNGTSQTVDTGTATDITGSAGFKIGIRETGAALWNGLICEIVAVTALTTTNRQLLEGYLAWKWGLEADLPGGHPYLAAAPTV